MTDQPQPKESLYGLWSDVYQDVSEQDIAAARRGLPDDFPKIVCLCGSTRFWRHFQDASLRETLAGNIVLSIGAAVASDEEHFGHLADDERADIKRKLDELHLRKIDLADEVYVLNVDGYVGESTAKEIAYAVAHQKPIRWLVAVECPRCEGHGRLLKEGAIDDGHGWTDRDFEPCPVCRGRQQP